MWSAFVADPGSLLSADTIEEMCQPQILLDPDQWNGAMGLGFFLIRSADRPHVRRPHRRHARPHHRRLHPPRVRHRRHRADEHHRHRLPPDAFAIELADHVVEHDPVEDAPWRPGTEIPDEYRAAARPLVLRGPALRVLGRAG